jgi:hypothetical protein
MFSDIFKITVDFTPKWRILPSMSIELRFKKGALVVQTSLKDEALPNLMALVQEHQADEEAPAIPSDEGTLMNFSGGAKLLDIKNGVEINSEKSSKEWLAKHSPAEVLNKLAWDTYPEKILALGAYHESKAGEDFDSWRSADITARFAEAKDSPPANFPREIASAIKSMFVAAKTPRTYIVSRTGWIKVSTAISKLPA